MFWRITLVDEDREITRSLKALKTLSNHNGRVSIAPDEVLLQPGYLAARRDAAVFIRQTKHQQLNWEAVDEAPLSLIRNTVDETSLLSPRPSPLERKNSEDR